MLSALYQTVGLDCGSKLEDQEKTKYTNSKENGQDWDTNRKSSCCITIESPCRLILSKYLNINALKL